MDALKLGRRKAFDEDSGEVFEQKRELAHRIRLEALQRLPELLERFEKRAVENGFKVHWAYDTQDANKIVEALLEERGAQRVLKGKSMISEEIHLNEHLEKLGKEVVETDLGELIVQMAKEHPSHIIAPAVHKNAKQIAELFHLEGGMEYSESIPDLISFAREWMRNKYKTADAGISGVNFAVAETGALCLVENEGNGRYTTTLPKLHIALMSLDKVIPKMEDLPHLLEMLSKSATGQKITSYVNIIGGVRNEELDGPEEVHVVILNHRRTEILKDELLRETLKCIRCGACINHCPIFVNIGGHSYNAVIPGPIGKILMPQIEGFDRHSALPTASSLCGACVDVCPVKIPITKILLKLRQKGVERSQKRPSNLTERMERFSWQAWAKVFSNPGFYRLQRKLTGYSAGLINGRMPVLRKWMKHRNRPPIAKKTLAELAKENGFYEN